MLILGIETSCDETGVALFDNRFPAKQGLLAQALHSQTELHQQYGGVVPELASREHLQHLLPLCQHVLQQGKKELKDLDLIAYTQGPGLMGCLLTGANFAKALGLALKIPVRGIHHLEAHILAALMSENPPTFPFIALLVSGGHTQLLDVQALGRYVLLGETLDDAVGECLDKTARLFNLPYPGGPHLSRLACQGLAHRFSLPRPMLHSGNLDFSFSGLKTAVLYQVKKLGQQITVHDQADLSCEIFTAIIDVLLKKSLKALAQSGYRKLVIAGGVGANQQLRQRLRDEAGDYTVFYPDPDLCTDNGAMIAFTAALREEKNLVLPQVCHVQPRWPFTEISCATIPNPYEDWV